MTTEFNTISKMLEQVKSYTNSSGQIQTSVANLEELFDDAYYNAGTKGAEDIQSQIDNLTAGIKALKKEAEDLQAQIEKANLKIDKKGTELQDIVNQINAGTAEYQQAVKEAAQSATRTAIQECKGNGSKNFKEYFTGSFKKQLKTSINPNALKDLFNQYSELSSQIDPITSEIDGYLAKVSNIQTKLDNTNATINLLEKTKNNLSTKMESAYKNVDTNSSTPIFSGKKELIANEILNGDYKTNLIKSSESKEDIQNKWLKTKETNPEGAKIDRCRLYNEGEAADSNGRVGNKELNSLKEALNNGMWQELQSAGMKNDEIMTWISKNYNVRLTKNKDTGTWTIPAGHGKSGHLETTEKYKNDATGASEVYNKIETLCKTEGNASANSVDKENISKLYDAMNPSSGDDILTKMYKNGFTFKEAMYVLTQAFPDSGVTYDINKQSGGRNYQIVDDTSASKSLYSTIKDKVKTYWGVEGGAATDTTSSVKTEVDRSDPITWQVGTKTYTLIVDRNANGKFDYSSKDSNDLLGSENGLDELRALDTDSNGTVSAEELAAGNVFIMINDQQESVANSKDVDKYKQGNDYTNSVDFNVAYSSAAALGVSVNLDSIKEGDKDAKSANGSELLNTMKVTMNGKQHNARETNNTDSNLETFYGQVAKNAKSAKNNEKIYTALSESQIKSSFTDKSNPDVQATQDILDRMKEFLNGLKQEALANGQDEYEYSLNMTWEEFLELYGTQEQQNNLDSKYLKGVIEVGSAKAKEWSDKEDDAFKNKTYKDTGKALDEYNEENKVAIVKTKKVKKETTKPAETTSAKDNSQEQEVPVKEDEPKATVTETQTEQTTEDNLNKKPKIE